MANLIFIVRVSASGCEPRVTFASGGMKNGGGMENLIFRAPFFFGSGVVGFSTPTSTPANADTSTIL